jgi:phosphoglycolate phosphatase
MTIWLCKRIEGTMKIMGNNMKTILFDFDGVMVDTFRPSLETHWELDQGEKITEDYYRKCLEGNVYDTFSEEDEQGKLANKKFYDVYIQKLFELPVIPSIAETLEKLAKDYQLIVVSSTITSPIFEWLTQHDLAKYFVEIMGGDVHKSKVEKIKMVFDKYKIKASDCVFITDTLGDLREAEKAGVSSLAVTYGFHEKERLQKGNPTGFIESPQEIIREIEKYWNKFN